MIGVLGMTRTLQALDTRMLEETLSGYASMTSSVKARRTAAAGPRSSDSSGERRATAAPAAARGLQQSGSAIAASASGGKDFATTTTSGPAPRAGAARVPSHRSAATATSELALSQETRRRATRLLGALREEEGAATTEVPAT